MGTSTDNVFFVVSTQTLFDRMLCRKLGTHSSREQKITKTKGPTDKVEERVRRLLVEGCRD